MNGATDEQRPGGTEAELGLDWVCPMCGVEVTPGDGRGAITTEDRLCPACGAPLGAGGPMMYRPASNRVPRIVAAVLLLLIAACLVIWLVAMLAPSN